ncbi:MAG: hypothetical protein IKP66_00095, partial [Lachnospiraceae bacterium]|nr:hypothetical protein [Lachnospiraceae bacterium]
LLGNSEYNEYGTLRIENNEYYRAIDGIMSSVYIASNSIIYTSDTKVIERNNTLREDSEGELHGIYRVSDKAMFISKGGVFDNNNSVMTIFFESIDMTGVIFKEWITGKVANTNRMQETFILHSRYGTVERRTYTEEVSDDNELKVYIGHGHKVCGVYASDSCAHNGLSEHTETIVYAPMTKIRNMGKFYLDKDITLTSNLTIAGDFYLCLNGHTLNTGSYRFINTVSNYNVYITNCKESGSIVMTGTEALFDGGVINIYGMDDHSRLKINANKIYSSQRAREGLMAYHTEFIGYKNESVAGSIFSFADSAESGIFNDVVIKNFHGQYLMYQAAKKGNELKFINEVLIEDNKITNHLMRLNGAEMTIEEGSRLLITNNTMKADSGTTCIIYSHNSEPTHVYNKGRMEIATNSFIKGETIARNNLSAFYAINEKTTIYTYDNSSIYIDNNEVDGETLKNNEDHTYGIYTVNKEGLIEHKEGVFISSESKITVYIAKSLMDTKLSTGTIFKNWTSTTVDYITGFKSSIMIDSLYSDSETNAYIRKINENNVVIVSEELHKHFACGKECVHATISEFGGHSKKINYEGLDMEYINDYGFPTEGEYYLKENITLPNTIRLTKDIYICLNGYALRSANFIGKSIYITDCNSTSGSIYAKSNEVMFTDMEEVNVFGNSNVNRISIAARKLSHNVKKVEIVNTNLNGSVVEGVTYDRLISDNDITYLVNTDINEYRFSSNLLETKKLVLDNADIRNNETEGVFIKANVIESYNEVDITMNTARNYVLKVEGETENRVVSGLLNIDNNIIINSGVEDVVNAAMYLNRDIELKGDISVSNNTFNLGENIVYAGIYLASSSFVVDDSYIKSYSNKGNSSLYHVYNIEANELFIREVGEGLDKENTVAEISLNTESGVGRVMKNTNSRELDEYKEMFSIDKYKNSKLYFEIDEDNYLILTDVHKHFVCGFRGECKHIDIASHSEIIFYEKNVSTVSIPTSGKAYLNGDTVIDTTTLDNDLYLCLNGYNLTLNGNINMGGHSIYITDCADRKGEILSEYNGYLFQNGSLSIYGDSDNKIVVNAVTLVYNSSSESGKLETYGVEFRGTNTLRNGNVFNLQGASHFEDVEITNFTASRIVNAVNDTILSGNVLISDNEVRNGVVINASSNLKVNKVSSVSIVDNRGVVSDEEANVSMINLDEEARLDVEGSLNVVDNDFSMRDLTTIYGTLSGINVGNESTVALEGNINVKGNRIEEEDVRAYDIYLGASDGRIKVYNKFDSSKSDIGIFIGNTEHYDGCIIDNWNETNVLDVKGTGFIRLHDYYDEQYDVRYNLGVDKERLMISYVDRHVHKVCGATASEICSHSNVERHNTSLIYKALLNAVYTTMPASGNYFLYNDVVFNQEIVVNEELNICLNGFTLSGVRFTGSGKVNITNCKIKEGKGGIIRNSSGYLFNNIDVNIVANDTLTVESNAVVDNEGDKEFKTHNVIIKEIDNSSKTNVFNLNSTNAKLHKTVISSYSNVDTLMNVGSAFIEDSKIINNDVLKLIVNSEGFLDLNDVEIKNNKFLDTLISNEGSGEIVASEGGVVDVSENSSVEGNTLFNINNRVRVYGELNLNKNEVDRGSVEKAILRINDDSEIFIDGSLNVLENKFINAREALTTVSSGIIVSNSGYMSMGDGSFTVKDNKVEGGSSVDLGNYPYQIYSKNNDGFIRQESGKFDVDNTFANISFDTETGQGIVYKDWNGDKVKNKDIGMAKLFVADTIRDSRLRAYRYTNEDGRKDVIIATNSNHIKYMKNDPIYNGVTYEVSGEMEDSVIEDGEAILTKNTYKAEGFNFVGWTTVPSSASFATKIEDVPVDYEDEGTIKGIDENEAEVKVYAKWKVVRYEVRYESGHKAIKGETTGTGRILGISDFIVASESFTYKDSYEFVKWGISRVEVDNKVVSTS